MVAMAPLTPLRQGRYTIHEADGATPAVETWSQSRRYDGTIVTTASREIPATYGTVSVESHASSHGRIYHAKIDWESGLRAAIKKATALYYATTAQLLVSRVLNDKEFSDEQVAVSSNFIFIPPLYVFVGLNLPRVATLGTTSVLIPAMSEATSTNLLVPSFESWSARLESKESLSHNGTTEEVAQYVYKNARMEQEAQVTVRTSDGVMVRYQSPKQRVVLDGYEF